MLQKPFWKLPGPSYNESMILHYQLVIGQDTCLHMSDMALVLLSMKIILNDPKEANI